MKYHIVTYGCQMNLHESEKIAGILKTCGYESEGSQEEADIIVFNTCCIRENAENHAFGNIGALKKLKKRNPSLLVALGGCMAQEAGKAEYLKRKFPFIDIVFGTHNLHELASLIEQKRNTKQTVIALKEAREIIEDDIIPARRSYPNAWVNIVYGCNNFCSYCIVPYVRGREKSREPEDILNEVQELVKAGYKEITLLGQNVDSYAGGGIKFPELLDRVASIEGNFRVAFMTSHPKDFSEELVAVMKKHSKICRRLHLPAQSGNNRILSLMNRRYTREKYLSDIALLKREIPDCEVTTDLIVGFPTETEEEFEDTLSLVKEADFSSAFTFVYSPRTGTKAASMEGQIPDEISKQRIIRLVECVNSQTRKKSAKCVGQTIEILVEDYDEKKDYYLGRDTYGRMGYFKSNRDRVGEFVNLKITKANGVSLFGEEA